MNCRIGLQVCGTDILNSQVYVCDVDDGRQQPKYVSDSARPKLARSTVKRCVVMCDDMHERNSQTGGTIRESVGWSWERG